ncbi:hypothetical protein HDU91_002779, partial [Kappamyces sp. JEL0680]
NESTIYAYTFHDLGTEKLHIVTENFTVGQYTHHFVGYLCDDIPKEFQGKPPGHVISNYYRELPQPDVINFVNVCGNKLYVVWARGGTPRVYPNNLGKPIGTSSTRYMVIETHFSNTELSDPNPVDNGSGFQFTVTKKFRENEIGMLTVGKALDSIRLTPGSVQSIASECPSECTSKAGGIPAAGLNIVSALSHEHKHGIAVTMRHVRDNVEIEPMPPMNYFDFNLQSYSWPSTTQPKLLPGDRLLLNCTYDLRRDTAPVVGGHSSNDEMCFYFIEYWPAMTYFNICQSSGANNTSSYLCPTGANDNSTVKSTAKDFTPLAPAVCPIVSPGSKSDAHAYGSVAASAGFAIVSALLGF